MSFESWNCNYLNKIWKKFLCIRDGLINKTLDKTPLKNKKRSGVLKSKRPKTDGITLYDKKSKDIYVDKISCSIDTKCSSYLEKRTVKMKSDTNTEIERHKLVIDKPWFSPSLSEINSFSSIVSPMSAPKVSEESTQIPVGIFVATNIFWKRSLQWINICFFCFISKSSTLP